MSKGYLTIETTEQAINCTKMGANTSIVSVFVTTDDIMAQIRKQIPESDGKPDVLGGVRIESFPTNYEANMRAMELKLQGQNVRLISTGADTAREQEALG